MEVPVDVFDIDGCNDDSTEETLVSVEVVPLALVNTPGLKVHLEIMIITCYQLISRTTHTK